MFLQIIYHACASQNFTNWKRKLESSSRIGQLQYRTAYGQWISYGYNKPYFCTCILGWNRNTNRRTSSISLHPSRLSKDELECIRDKLQGQTYRRLTRLNYHEIWTLFNEFFIQLDQKPEKWSDLISLFETHLVQTKHQSPTIKSYCSAIRTILKQEGIHVEENAYILSSLVKACKMQNNVLFVCLPIQ